VEHKWCHINTLIAANEVEQLVDEGSHCARRVFGPQRFPSPATRDGDGCQRGKGSSRADIAREGGLPKGLLDADAQAAPDDPQT
jgi:hypothetical protein